VVTVLAAASLTEAFEQVAGAYEAANPGADIVFSFAGSQQLAGQVLDGAPADVFASANPEQMARVVDADLAAGLPSHFSSNLLAIAVEPGNPKDIRELADLARDDVVVVLAAAEVPAGAYTREALARTRVTVDPASLEDDVRGVLSKVALGEADAGVVYATDIAGSEGSVEAVELPAGINVAAQYVIVALRDAPNAAGAAAFVAFVMSDAGQAILRAHGFAEP
jgi:molybdate transport system substrate-binding protein